MAKGVIGVSFNVVKTSDEKLMLEWQTVDPINRQPTKCIIIAANFEELSKKLNQVLDAANVTT